ncbi:hypothetical protein [Francisella philomiragia]|uniref:hypothetical protein n=1 Tax=Francisella philomiragia TaxID=28110 RepID=UPI0019040F48|nr:hypothetical protein [Francisella philomiragia]MBK2256665.1 hypothetical protein [Francisella philomiragia]MBK2269323.1 hypothetical protein [Francisella philomiragia]MBK2271312.1 hypothetical protein [Francisella philomiragia]MBK2275092.1 hypothetical protein [Francisella philomiragia]MBK2294686.1 hypothetical protein [Francisella philomiragia]
MTTTVFDSELNDFSRKFLVKNSGTPEPSPQDFIKQKTNIDISLFENLMLFDTITFKVHGENIPLTILLNHFGVKGVEALLDQNAIKFVLWDQMLGYVKSNIIGIDPLIQGRYTSPAHSDPEESIRLGFEWMKIQPRTSDKRNLIRKIRDIYSIPDEDLSRKSLEISKSAFHSGKLKVYGLDSDKLKYSDLDLNNRKKLNKCAEEIQQYSYLINNNMSSYSNFEFYQIFNDSNKKIHSAINLQGNFKNLSKLENIPDFKEIFSNNSIPFAKLLKFRNKNSSKKFRAWLGEYSDNDDINEIVKEYISSIDNPKGFFQTKIGRLTKSIAISSIGAGVGHIVANTPGTIAGVAIANYLTPTAEFGLDMLDEFVLSGLTKGWTPKIFFNDLSKLEKSLHHI